MIYGIRQWILLQVHRLLRDPSLGVPIEYILHKLLILEHDQVRVFALLFCLENGNGNNSTSIGQIWSNVQ